MSEDSVPYILSPSRRLVRLAKPKRPRSVRYGSGRYAPASNGRGFDCSICARAVRVRGRVPDEASARAWIDAQETALKLGRPPLSRAQLLDAQDALAELPPGVTLLEAARLWRSLRAPDPAAVGREAPLSLALEAFLSECADGRLSPSTVGQYRQSVRRLSALRGDIPVSAVTRDMVVALVSGMAPCSRNGVLRGLSAFGSWCVRSGLAVSNPASSVSRARESEPPKGVLTPGQVEGLMACSAAARPDLVPYLALALFAGIRPEELRRLPPDRIGGRYVLLDGAVTKTADARTVEISAPLRAWLAAYPVPACRRGVCPLARKRLYAVLRDLRALTVRLSERTGRPELALRGWPKDGPRHTYATCMYELTGDAARVAASMGHAGTGVFFRHYRALSRPGDGQAFLDVTPEKVRSLITVCEKIVAEDKQKPKTGKPARVRKPTTIFVTH